MAKQENLFRKASLERLSSPEQLDQLMHVTTPKGWIALISLMALLFVAILWGIFGQVPTQVQGLGILIRTGGVFDIETKGSGAITANLVKVGDSIKQGDVVATIAIPSLENQIEKSRLQLKELNTQQKQSKEFNEKDLKLKAVYFEKQRESAQYTTNTSQKRLLSLKERINSQEELLKEGLITKQNLLDTRQSYVQTENQILQSKNQIKQINVTENELKQKYDQQALDFKIKVDDAKKDLQILGNQYRIQAEVISAYTGQVLEVLYDEGSQVVKGNTLVSVELTGAGVKNLEAMMYVGPTKGKMIQQGMHVQVSPANVKREKYGYLIGKVTYVSEFPASTQAMLRLIKNPELVKTLAVGGAPYEVQVNLEDDKSTYSGLKWSSGKGPKTRIHSGTLATGQIITEEQRPITLVIPALKKFLGI